MSAGSAKNTLLLDHTIWDLVLDANGNIAMAQPPYALAQDAASAIKIFRGEYWYDTTVGIPYFANVLGTAPPPAKLLKEAFNAAALTVPGVVQARTFLSGFDGRRVSGQVQVIDASGKTVGVGF